VPTYKKGDKADCSNYQRTSLLSATYKILSNFLLTTLTLYADKITADHQYGFRCETATTDHVFCIVTHHLLVYADGVIY
jgi:hypothetical protein